jgi:hypothetical protein
VPVGAASGRRRRPVEGARRDAGGTRLRLLHPPLNTARHTLPGSIATTSLSTGNARWKKILHHASSPGSNVTKTRPVPGLETYQLRFVNDIPETRRNGL